jgi:hypothetical protein
MIFKFRHERGGDHIHISIFAGKTDGSLGKAGDICLREEEWQEFRSLIESVPARMFFGEKTKVIFEGDARKSSS